MLMLLYSLRNDYYELVVKLENSKFQLEPKYMI